MLEKYLTPTLTIDCGNRLIKKKAGSLTEKCKKDFEKAKNLFYFVRDEIKYDPYGPNYLVKYHIASRTLKRKNGYCVSKAILLAALARAIGIPARLRFADIRNHLLPERYQKLIGTNVLVYHGYDELYIGGKWIKATPVFDLELCKKHRIIPVEFDGKHHSKLHSHTLDGKLHIEYVRDHGYYPDLPFNEMLNARAQVYGFDFIERRKRLLKQLRKTKMI